ncbi:thermonuclease family protein [Paracoccus ravus]|uniref:thermonuclease family protein n=1 Tax=Paracoccus ravus TaxID=2447760 RepID=UPI001FD6F438|nr:thermonuclease family protein [Paracoccus ravus]
MEITALIVLAAFAAVLMFWRLSRSRMRQELEDEIARAFPANREEESVRSGTKAVEHVPTRKVLQGAAYVVDGDTITIKKTQIRLFGIDAAELDHPYGKKAKWALTSLCKGHSVRAEVTEQDTHGRTVARCYLPDGRDLSAEMVKLGLAIDWPKFSGGQYRTLETADARKKLWLADARQKGRLDVWERFEAKQGMRKSET